jgi:hypothetical protein
MPAGAPQSVAGLAAGLASEETDRAADLVLARTQLAADLAIKQAERAAVLAYEKGQRDAQVDARLDGHESRLLAMNGSIGKQAIATGDLAHEVRGLGGSFKEHMAVETALAAALKDATTRGISARAHYISLGLFMVGVAGLILGVPHA